AAHAEDGAVEEDVLAPGQLRVEAGPNLQQRPGAAGHVSPTVAGLDDPRENFQQRALTGAVMPDQSDDLPGPHRDRKVLERPERVSPRLLAAAAREPPERALGGFDHALAQGAVAAPAEAEVVALAEPAGLNREVAHRLRCGRRRCARPDRSRRGRRPAGPAR